MQYRTLESRVSSDIQTPRSWLNSATASFFNSLLGVWISDETLLVYDILHVSLYFICKELLVDHKELCPYSRF